MKSHEAPVTESMQQCIDYIKQNEDEFAFSCSEGCN